MLVGRRVRDVGADRDRDEENPEVEIFCAFDYDENVFRFDRVESETVRIPQAAENANLKKFCIHEYKKKSIFIKTPDKVITWVSPFETDEIIMATAIGIHPPDANPPRSVRPFDIRAVGLYFWRNFEKGDDFHEVFGNLNTNKWNIRQINNSKVHIVERKMGEKSLTHSIWIDENRGYSPIRLEVKNHSNHLQNGGPMISSVSTWEKTEGIWVPASYRIEHQESANGVTESYELQFDWKRVNAEIDPVLFSQNGIEVNELTPVFDYRLGEPIPLDPVVRKGDVK